MEFLKERVYSALNADELKPGSKVIVANYLESLIAQVEANSYPSYVVELSQIMGTSSMNRFKAGDKTFNLAYLVSLPEEKDWIAYVCRKNPDNYYLTACRSDAWEMIQKDCGAKTKLFEGTEVECKNWYISRRHFADVMAAWEDGKEVQIFQDGKWCDIDEPLWGIKNEYRIKPEPLKWTDLKIGDVVTNGTETYMVTGIDTSCEPDGEGDVCHIYMGDCWYTDEDLKDWEKVE